MNDRKDCFARINEKTCNALIEKKCENCHFYKHKSNVKNYSKYMNYAINQKEQKSRC